MKPSHKEMIFALKSSIWNLFRQTWQERINLNFIYQILFQTTAESLCTCVMHNFTNSWTIVSQFY